jgi:hypothetical protein
MTVSGNLYGRKMLDNQSEFNTMYQILWSVITYYSMLHESQEN